MTRAKDLGYVPDGYVDCPKCDRQLSGDSVAYVVGTPGRQRVECECPRCGTLYRWTENIHIENIKTRETAAIQWVSSDGQWAIIGYTPGAGKSWYPDAVGALELLNPEDDNVIGVFLLADGSIAWDFDDPDASDYYPEDVQQKCREWLGSIYSAMNPSAGKSRKPPAKKAPAKTSSNSCRSKTAPKSKSTKPKTKGVRR